jgi:hypothetical protein
MRLSIGGNHKNKRKSKLKRMKISTFFWLLCIGAFLLIVGAFVAGRFFEKTTALQTDVIALTSRVNQLEAINVRRTERWAWLCRIGTHIPFMKRLMIM